MIKCDRCYDRNISRVLPRIGSDISRGKWNPKEVEVGEGVKKVSQLYAS